MTRAELTEFFIGKTPILPALGASAYEVPTLAWVRGEFYDAFRKWLYSLGEDTWTVNWECRDFARAYACYMQLCWARSNPRPGSADGCAAGEIWFIPDATDPTKGHAICPVVTDQGLVFIDPQNNELWPMTAAQLGSAFFLRF